MAEREPNGDYDWRENLRTLKEAMLLNLDEHDRIWRSIERLRESQLETGEQIKNLVAAIRDLIDRIPPKTYVSGRGGRSGQWLLHR